MDGQSHTDPRGHGDAGGESGTTRRDLRTVLRRLVVAEGDGSDLSIPEVARAAGGTERFVPELLAALEDDATAVRAGAAWTLCALADDRPDAVPALAARLADRVGDGPFEVGQVLAYLRGRYPGRVADAIDAAVDAERARTGRGTATRDDGRGVTGRDAAGDATGPGRSPPAGTPGRTGDPDPPAGRVQTDGGVPARVETGAVADLGDGRQVVRPSRAGDPDVRQRRLDGAGRAGTRPASPADPPRDHPTHPDFDDADADGGPRAVGEAESTAADPTPDPVEATVDRPAGSTAAESDDGTVPVDRPETPETFAAIGSLSSLDRLSAVDTGVEGRYATGYRCRAVEDGEERGVSVRLFDRPDSDRLAFRADLEESLARWRTLGDIEGVVGVAEWGRRPRPWVRTEPVDASLADRGRPPVDEAVDRAVALARSVAGLHARGTVHGGIDPRNVVYPCDSLAALDRPALDNVGLMSVFREYFEPANYLDPRFAAPEYFDDDFGGVDAATDVYGLGAVVYYLATGRPPFVGSYGEVRQGVLGSDPPAPSEVREGVPDCVDPVVAKALAKRKLARYDAVEPFLADLDRVREGGR